MVARAEVPEGALIARYLAETGAHVDAYCVAGPREIGLPDYVSAFFTSPVFRLERALLRVFARTKSSDAQVRALAEGTGTHMALWEVEARSEHELLLCVPGTPIRTWLAIRDGKLRFGSVVLAEPNGTQSLFARVLMPFHALYSRVLLWAAARRI